MSKAINYEEVTINIFGKDYQCEVIGTYTPEQPATMHEPGESEEFDIEVFTVPHADIPRVCINELLCIPDIMNNVIRQLKES